MKKLILILFPLLFISCGEEVLTQNTQNEGYTSSTIESKEYSTCSQFTFRKPPVDILYVIDNSGSTLASSFQSIKGEIQKTIDTVSGDFDYHIYVAPLNPGPTDSIQGYPLMVSDPSSIPSIASVNMTNSDSLEMFADASGNNNEFGFERVKNIINYNRSNGIFRDDANTIVVMISNGDDTQTKKTLNGNTVDNPDYPYSTVLNEYKKFTKTYSNSSSEENLLKSRMFRFISVVANSSCNGWKKGETYQRLSRDLYDYQGLSDNDKKDVLDLCSQNYASLFSVVNNSIQAVIDGHKYDHWKISSASESEIQTDDIQIYKLSKSGVKTEIFPGTENGFEYLGYKTNQKLNYEPTDKIETDSGLMVKLHGEARVSHPDCIIAKTRTPTEYFGYVALPRDPELSSVKIEIDGKAFPQSGSNGWSYLGWRDTLNIKVPGPTDAAVTPAVNKSGYFLQLHGDAIFSNGQTIKVFYKAKSN